MKKGSNDFQILKALCVAVATLLLTCACSTQRNTQNSRWWHSFTTRYNVYYNGAQAYINGSLTKENGNKDDYTDLIPLYTVGNSTSRALGASDYDKAIVKAKKAITTHSIKKRPKWNSNKRKTDKDREWLNRKEYNPFLWKAWMLLGRSQFMKGDFYDATATFLHITRLYATQPAIYCRARAWLTRCYIYTDRLYEAEDMITKSLREPLHWASVREWDYTLADYYLHQQDFNKASEYLKKAINHETRRKQRARMWYLLGQVEDSLGHSTNAYEAYKHATKLHPNYELALQARIAMTGTMVRQNGDKAIKRLHRMATLNINKDYVAQIYYAIGNIHLANNDTTKAISAYKKCRRDSLNNSFEKGLALTKLGDICWKKQNFVLADSVYSEALPLVGNTYKDYNNILWRINVLKELVPNIQIVSHEKNDSTLEMPDAMYNAAIIAKDKMGDLVLGRQLLERITKEFASYKRTDEVLYHLFLLNLRENNKTQASAIQTRMSTDFHDSKWTAIISDPDYQYNAKFGSQIEDSLYTATYNAFKNARYAEVDANTDFSTKRFPMGANRDKFLFIGGLSRLNSGNIESCKANMQSIITQFPNSKLREMAASILKGIDTGRTIYGYKANVNDIWQQRSIAMSGKDSAQIKPFTAERNASFSFLLVYSPDSVNTNKLLFELARYNFTNFLVRSFDIKTDTLGGLARMRVDGFLSFDEALQYTHLLYKNEAVRKAMTSCHAIIISQDNLKMLGTMHSYKDYEAFYEVHFNNVPISKEQLLDRPVTIEYLPENNNGQYKSNDTTTDDADSDIIIIDTDSDSSNGNDYDDVIEIEEGEIKNLEDEYSDLDGF